MLSVHMKYSGISGDKDRFRIFEFVAANDVIEWNSERIL